MHGAVATCGRHASQGDFVKWASCDTRPYAADGPVPYRASARCANPHTDASRGVSLTYKVGSDFLQHRKALVSDISMLVSVLL